MNCAKKKLLIFFLCTLGFFFLPKSAFAANENFSTAAQVTYTVASSGLTHVALTETLTNLSDKYYASSYQIHLGFQDIQNVSASDPGGVITPAVTQTENGEDVAVSFTNPAFGKGKTFPFTISFDTKEIASLNGSIWEVNIPGLSHAEDFSNFTVHVVVPPYFGAPTYRKPALGNTSLIFTKDQLGKSGISLAFGDKQVYAFHLTYTIKNSELFPATTEIALPPNTTYQHVEIDTLSPRPMNVRMDTDGNWLAQYLLSPSQVLKIVASGKAYLSLFPSTEELSQSDRVLYLRSSPYWQTQDTKIKNLATELNTPDAIYSYVVDTLHYDFARISDTQDRLGAVGVLTHPDQAVCLEFTDLFIALARAAGIPARELDGYGYTQNTIARPLSLQKEVLHAWPEYYDMARHTWVMVDPTWQNTTGGVDYFHTFDFDHLTLVIKGVSSVYPIPAGGYKLPGQENEKDVHVSFAIDSVEPQPTASLGLISPNEFVAGFPLQANFSVTNTGSVLFPAQTAFVSILGSTQQYHTQAIPPFGESTYPLSLGKTQFLTNTSTLITIRMAGESIEKRIHIVAISSAVLVGGGIFVLCCIIIYFIARRPRRVSVF